MAKLTANIFGEYFGESCLGQIAKNGEFKRFEVIKKYHSLT